MFMHEFVGRKIGPMTHPSKPFNRAAKYAMFHTSLLVVITTIINNNNNNKKEPVQ